MPIQRLIKSSVYRPLFGKSIKLSDANRNLLFLVFLLNIRNTLNALSFFEKNTDATATNRGFYFQYLNTLKSWLDIYNSNADTKLFCEVEDDLKKVDIDGSLKFSQFKCYSSNFSFSSKEVQKSFYNFYTLYYKYFGTDPKFHFYTNSTIAPSEELLIKWHRFQDALREDHKDEIVAVVTPILKKLFSDFATAQIEGINKELGKLEKKSFTQAKKEAARIKKIAELEDEVIQINGELSTILSHIDANIKNFISSINFTFLSTSPDEANASIEQDCILSIKAIPGFKHTEKLFFSRLLTEIYRKSSDGEVLKRLLDKELLKLILEESAEDLKKNSDNRFETILTQGFLDVKESLGQLHIKMDNLDSKTPAVTTGLILSNYDDAKIIDRVNTEKGNDTTKSHQSNLERKINDIDWKDDQERKDLIQIATDLRCSYAIYMEELHLSGQKREYDALRALEKQIKLHCIHAVEKFGNGTSFDSNAFWASFKEELSVKIKEFSAVCNINLQETFVFAQMYQIAAECQLKWVPKPKEANA